MSLNQSAEAVPLQLPSGPLPWPSPRLAPAPFLARVSLRARQRAPDFQRDKRSELGLAHFQRRVGGLGGSVGSAMMVRGARSWWRGAVCCPSMRRRRYRTLAVDCRARASHLANLQDLGEKPDLLRTSITKLIQPTTIVSTPIAMQSSDVAEYVPVTIQITPAPIIPRETRYASTLSFMPSYSYLLSWRLAALKNLAKGSKQRDDEEWAARSNSSASGYPRAPRL